MVRPVILDSLFDTVPLSLRQACAVSFQKFWLLKEECPESMS